MSISNIPYNRLPKDRNTRRKGIFTVIKGDVSGQVIAGNHNQQIQQTIAQPIAISEEDLITLQRRFHSLKALIDAEAPSEKKQTALQHAEELEAALLEGGLQRKSLTKMEYIRDWFVEHLPALAGSISGLIVHPIVGRLVEAGGDALVAEFKRRFGG